MITKGIIMIIIGGTGFIASTIILIKLLMRKSLAIRMEEANNLPNALVQKETQIVEEPAVSTESVVASTILISPKEEPNEIKELVSPDQTILLNEEKKDSSHPFSS